LAIRFRLIGERWQNEKAQHASGASDKDNNGYLASGSSLLTLVIYVTWEETTGGITQNAGLVDDPALGPETAPVVIVEYADFGCTACRAWHNFGIREPVLATFGEQVRFVWKDFPVITPLWPQAAESGHCAAAQGKFWADQAGASVDWLATANQAYLVGRQGTWMMRLSEQMIAMLGRREVTPELVVDVDQLRAIVARIAAEAQRPGRAASQIGEISVRSRSRPNRASP
jgi:hypothetical protein